LIKHNGDVTPKNIYYMFFFSKFMSRNARCTGLLKMIVGVLTTCHTQYT